MIEAVKNLLIGIYMKTLYVLLLAKYMKHINEILIKLDVMHVKHKIKKGT